MTQLQDYLAVNPNMITLKADFVAQRSYKDNITSMFEKNTALLIAAILFIFIYISLALGYFPDTLYSRFFFALVCVIVVLTAFLAACGCSFYNN